MVVRRLYLDVAAAAAGIYLSAVVGSRVKGMWDGRYSLESIATIIFSSSRLCGMD